MFSLLWIPLWNKQKRVVAFFVVWDFVWRHLKQMIFEVPEMKASLHQLLSSLFSLHCYERQDDEKPETAKSCGSTGRYKANKPTSVTAEWIKQTAQLHKENWEESHQEHNELKNRESHGNTERLSEVPKNATQAKETKQPKSFTCGYPRVTTLKCESYEVHPSIPNTLGGGLVVV